MNNAHATKYAYVLSKWFFCSSFFLMEWTLAMVDIYMFNAHVNQSHRMGWVFGKFSRISETRMHSGGLMRYK